jgi:hypothetical protein
MNSMENKTAAAENERHAKRPSTHTLAIDSLQLDDGTVVDLVEHPERPEGTRFVVWKGGAISYQNKLKIGDTIYVPRDLGRKIFRHVRLPQAAEHYGTQRELMRRICELILRCVSIHGESCRYPGAFRSFHLAG